MNKEPLQESSRSEMRAKRRKTNIVLNSLIVLVLLLIIIVSINIFGGNDKQTKSDGEQNEVEVSQNVENKSYENKNSSNSNGSTGNQSKENKETNAELTESDTNKDREALEAGKIVTEEEGNPEVKTSMVNPLWEPIGTSQGSTPAQDYDLEGVDWNEMTQAIVYATGFEKEQMTILHLGNNGANKAVGTILQKDTKQKYRVYMEWVNEKGWKPVLVEELIDEVEPETSNEEEQNN